MGKAQSSKSARGSARGRTVQAGRESTTSKRSRGRPWWKGPVAWVGALVTAVVTGVTVALATGLSEHVVSAGQPSTLPAGPHLEVDQVELTNASSANPVQPYKIDIKLLNTGTQLVAINAAVLVINDAVTLPICAAQGDFQPTGSYKTYMPERPSRDQVVNIPVSQLVPANGADRFDLQLATPLPRTSPAVSNIYLDRIHIYLTYNINTKPLDIGEVITSFPTVPSQGDYFWNKYWAAHPHAFYLSTSNNPAPVKACDVRNSYALTSILRQPGMRTAELAAIPSQLAY